MRNVVVTGGSRGLGLAMTRLLAASGYRVIVIARHETRELLDTQRASEKESLGAIEFRPFDLSQLGEIGGFSRALRTEFGPIYGLVNNAGLGTGGVLGNMQDAAIERLITLNTSAPILLTKYLVRSMMSARNGRVVNIASIVASNGYSGLSVYSATKASLLGFTRSLARELGPVGITVNAIAPGFIATEMTQELTDAQREKIARRSALHRLADPEDVAHSVEFLLSEAARNITGVVMTVDAGNTA